MSSSSAVPVVGVVAAQLFSQQEHFLVNELDLANVLVRVVGANDIQ